MTTAIAKGVKPATRTMWRLTGYQDTPIETFEVVAETSKFWTVWDPFWKRAVRRAKRDGIEFDQFNAPDEVTRLLSMRGELVFEVKA